MSLGAWAKASLLVSVSRVSSLVSASRLTIPAMPTTLSTATDAGVGLITLTRAREYNTIIGPLRDELAEAIDADARDPEVHVILLRAEGPAFCAGYALDWAT